MTELTVHQPDNQALTLPQQMDYAVAVAKAGILPKAYQGNPGSVLIAMGLGSAMGLSPAESLYRIHVIEGKPSASAELIATNVRRAGHKLRVRGDARSATVQIVRADDPDFPFEVTWKIEDAQRAGLASKGVWKSYPAAMLKARAITECARTACPEALYGIQYTEEEVHDLPAEPAERPKRESAAALLTQTPQGAAPSGTTQGAATPGAVEVEGTDAATSDAPPPADPPAEAATPLVTKAQLAKIAAQMRDLDITERDHALAYIEKAIGLKIASRSELTRDEAKRLIDALDEDIAQANGDTSETTSSPDGNADS